MSDEKNKADYPILYNNEMFRGAGMLASFAEHELDKENDHLTATQNFYYKKAIRDGILFAINHLIKVGAFKEDFILSENPNDRI